MYHEHDEWTFVINILSAEIVHCSHGVGRVPCVVCEWSVGVKTTHENKDHGGPDSVMVLILGWPNNTAETCF